LNLPALTSSEKKAAWFILSCALVGSLLCVFRSSRPDSGKAEGTRTKSAAIRERIVRADQASTARNRSGSGFDLNKATERELASLPGLGPALAHFVVQDRASQGRYNSVAELARVRGIGPKRLSDVSAFLYVQPQEGWVSAPSKNPPGSQP
jgi:ERCC4-type nuclease